MTAEDIFALKQLWQEAFSDSEAFTDAFFTKGFSRDRFHCVREEGLPVSALYWFNCELGGHKLAYIYGVATLKSHRGRGLAGQLLEETHNILRNRGYAGAILVPRKQSLFDFYRRFGYRTAVTSTEFTCTPGTSPALLREISPDEYARLRPAFLPDGGVEQAGDTLTLLQSYCRFYAGEAFLLVCEALPEGLWAQELLGNAQDAPGILRALGFSQGRFRTPGTDRGFAMFLPLRENCPRPNWFGLALD